MINKFITVPLGNIFAIMLMTFVVYVFAEIFRSGVVISYINLQILLLLLLAVSLLLRFETAPSKSFILDKFVLLLVVLSVGGIIYLLFDGSLINRLIVGILTIGLLFFIIFSIKPQKND